MQEYLNRSRKSAAVHTARIVIRMIPANLCSARCAEQMNIIVGKMGVEGFNQVFVPLNMFLNDYFIVRIKKFLESSAFTSSSIFSDISNQSKIHYLCACNI